MAETAEIDLVWGINGIARVIGRTDRATYAMLAKGALPAKQVGGRWVADRNELIAFFKTGEAA